MKHFRAFLMFLMSGPCPGFANGQEFNNKVKVSEIMDGVATLITISTNVGAKAATLKYEGTVRSMKYNADRTICALDLAPGTQINDVYVIATMKSGRIAIIRDFNDRLLRALGDKADKLNTDYVYVDRVEDRTFDVTLGAKDEPTYSLKATVTARGEIEIVPNSITKD